MVRPRRRSCLFRGWSSSPLPIGSFSRSNFPLGDSQGFPTQRSVGGAHQYRRRDWDGEAGLAWLGLDWIYLD